MNTYTVCTYFAPGGAGARDAHGAEHGRDRRHGRRRVLDEATSMMSDVSCVPLVRGPRARTTLRPFRWAYGCHTQMRDSDRMGPRKKRQRAAFRVFFFLETPSTAQLHRSRQHTGAHRPRAPSSIQRQSSIPRAYSTHELLVRKEALWEREADPPRGIAWVVCGRGRYSAESYRTRRALSPRRGVITSGRIMPTVQ